MGGGNFGDMGDTTTTGDTITTITPQCRAKLTNINNVIVLLLPCPSNAGLIAVTANAVRPR